MIIQSIKLFKYSLPLTKKLQLGQSEINTREGYLIEISSDSNIKSISEIAPLPFFSIESLEDVIHEVAMFKNKFVNQSVPPDILTQLSTYCPSVRFGIESAFLQLTAKSKELSLVELLHPNAKQIISVNALLVGDKNEIIKRATLLYEKGYCAFKIKIGRNSIQDDIEIVTTVRKIVGNDSKIRLDANRAYDVESTQSFFDKVQSMDIDYIEEPFQTFEMLADYLQTPNNQMPLALDESLTLMNPEDLNQLYSLKAIVLKPMLLGYTNSMMFAKKAFALGIQPVISSSFETSIGTYILASMGAIIDTTIPIGVDTLAWFQNDVVSKQIEIIHGRIDLKNHIDIDTVLDYTKLTEVDLDNK